MNIEMLKEAVREPARRIIAEGEIDGMAAILTMWAHGVPLEAALTSASKIAEEELGTRGVQLLTEAMDEFKKDIAEHGA